MDDEDIIYLSATLAKEVNRLLGYDGFARSEHLLESALAAPKSAAYYAHADIVEQAACLLEHVAMNHPFYDGNKRTAMILCSTFLLVNNYELMHEDEDEELAYAQLIELSVTTRDFSEVLTWIMEHLTTLE
jgi:death-on-curing protein